MNSEDWEGIGPEGESEICYLGAEEERNPGNDRGRGGRFVLVMGVGGRALVGWSGFPVGLGTLASLDLDCTYLGGEFLKYKKGQKGACRPVASPVFLPPSRDRKPAPRSVTP